MTQILIIVTMTAVPFLPASNLFVTTGFVVAERVMYLPSIGFVLLVAKGVQRASRYTSKIATFVPVCLLITFALKTYTRCFDW